MCSSLYIYIYWIYIYIYIYPIWKKDGHNSELDIVINKNFCLLFWEIAGNTSFTEGIITLVGKIMLQFQLFLLET